MHAGIREISTYPRRIGDMRRAARMSVHKSFASYLPALFGPGKYVILDRPERLAAALVDWLRQAALSVQ